MNERNKLRKFITESVELLEDFPIHLYPEITGEKVSPEELEVRRKKYGEAMKEFDKRFGHLPPDERPMF